METDEEAETFTTRGARHSYYWRSKIIRSWASFGYRFSGKFLLCYNWSCNHEPNRDICPTWTSVRGSRRVSTVVCYSMEQERRQCYAITSCMAPFGRCRQDIDFGEGNCAKDTRCSITSPDNHVYFDTQLDLPRRKGRWIQYLKGCSWLTFSMQLNA